MTVRFLTSVSILIVTGLAVAGCGGSSLLGGRKAPDETQVIDGPSLAVPPDFDLRPPTKGGDYNREVNSRKTEEARTLITGSSAAESGEGAAPEWLIDETGVAPDPNIRDRLEEDYTEDEVQPQKRSWWNPFADKATEDDDGDRE